MSVSVKHDSGSYQFGEVHVSQNPHDHGLLRLSRVGPLHGSQRPQHRQDVPQAKVIVHLEQRTSTSVREPANVFTYRIVAPWDVCVCYLLG